MIEKRIKNELTRKRYRRFKKMRRSVISVWIFLALVFFSLTAEFWANSKPIFLRHNGSFYMPIYFTTHPSVFGQEDHHITDYRKLMEDHPESWALWPLVRWNPFESNTTVDTYPSGPTSENWFGTDDRGRDVLSRLLYGFRYSFGFSVLVWLLTYFLGTVMGSIMGFAGGRVDLVGQRAVEVFESMPTLLLLITLVSIFGASMPLLVAFSACFGWMLISIYIRAEFLKLRKREFVEAARAMGGSRARMIFRHILPNALSPIVTFSPFTIASYISTLAILDYLGFGLPPPTPSWGELLQQAQRYFSIAWWLAVFPSAALFISLVVLTLIGEGVRDAFDPRKT